MTNDGFKSILPFLTHITTINLSFNSLTEEVLESVIKEKQKLISLRIINMVGNKLNERKAKNKI